MFGVRAGGGVYCDLFLHKMNFLFILFDIFIAFPPTAAISVRRRRRRQLADNFLYQIASAIKRFSNHNLQRKCLVVQLVFAFVRSFLSLEIYYKHG